VPEGYWPTAILLRAGGSIDHEVLDDMPGEIDDDLFPGRHRKPREARRFISGDCPFARKGGHEGSICGGLVHPDSSAASVDLLKFLPRGSGNGRVAKVETALQHGVAVWRTEGRDWSGVAGCGRRVIAATAFLNAGAVIALNTGNAKRRSAGFSCSSAVVMVWPPGRDLVMVAQELVEGSHGVDEQDVAAGVGCEEDLVAGVEGASGAKAGGDPDSSSA
jgi:hypothetical protein